MSDKYTRLIQAILDAGFYTTTVEKRDGWDRVSVCSKKTTEGYLTGNSFWTACVDGQWYLGAWGGFLYLADNERKVIEFCIEWLRFKPNETAGNFSSEFCQRFNLIKIDTPEHMRSQPEDSNG